MNRKTISMIKMILGWTTAIVTIVMSCIMYYITDSLIESASMKRTLNLIGLSVGLLGIGIKIILVRDASNFECPNCKNIFEPDIKTYLISPNRLARRKMKCPRCGETGYCRRRLKE